MVSGDLLVRRVSLLRGGGHSGTAARDEAPRPQVATRPGGASEAERANEPRGGVGADPGVGPGWIRQDDAADGVAGCRCGRRTVRRVALARPARQRSRVVLDVCCRRAEYGRARGWCRCARAPATAPVAERGGPCRSAQRPRCHLERCRAGARRLPRHRRARRAGRDGLPAGASTPADTPGDRQPHRPAVAAGPVARAWRARRDPRGRSALHARRGRGVSQRGDGTGADRSRCRSTGGAHRRMDRRAAASGALDAGARGHRRVHRRLRRG